MPALLVFSGLLFWKIALDLPFRELINRPGDGSLTFLAGMNVMVSGQFAAAFTSSDLSRYSKDLRSVWLGIWTGIVPVSAHFLVSSAESGTRCWEFNRSAREYRRFFSSYSRLGPPTIRICARGVGSYQCFPRPLSLASHPSLGYPRHGARLFWLDPLPSGMARNLGGYVCAARGRRDRGLFPRTWSTARHARFL